MTPSDETWPSRRIDQRAALVGLLFAGIGSIASLWLSIGMGLKACPLCFYQRSFVMAAFSVLGVGWWLDRDRLRLTGLLSLPLVWAGFGVAAYHEYLVMKGVLECPAALLGIGSAPAQSLALFVLLVAACTAAACPRQAAPVHAGAKTCVALVLLGLAMAVACVVSSPPLPPAPSAPYDPAKQPLEMCRPPFRAV